MNMQVHLFVNIYLKFQRILLIPKKRTHRYYKALQIKIRFQNASNYHETYLLMAFPNVKVSEYLGSQLTRVTWYKTVWAVDLEWNDEHEQ